MNKKYKLVLTASVLLLLITQCRQKNDAGKTQKIIIEQAIHDTAVKQKQIVLRTKFDSIIQQLKSRDGLSKNDMLSLKVIDTFYANNSNKTISCESTVQLNDSIFFSIINLPDTEGICFHSFILTIDEKNKKPVAAK